MSDLESTIKQAFQLAEKSRAAAGMRARIMKIRKRRDGTQTLDLPRSYLIKLWLPAWHYADILLAKARDGHQGSLTKYIHAMIERQVPPITARPPAKKPRQERPVVARLRRATG